MCAGQKVLAQTIFAEKLRTCHHYAAEDGEAGAECGAAVHAAIGRQSVTPHTNNNVINIFVWYVVSQAVGGGEAGFGGGAAVHAAQLGRGAVHLGAAGGLHVWQGAVN